MTARGRALERTDLGSRITSLRTHFLRISFVSLVAGLAKPGAHFTTRRRVLVDRERRTAPRREIASGVVCGSKTDRGATFVTPRRLREEGAAFAGEI